MFINKKNGASYGFVAPEIEADNGKKIEVQFPTFEVVNVQTVQGADSVFEALVNVERTETLLDLGEFADSSGVRLTVNNPKALQRGSRLLVKFKGDGVEVAVNGKSPFVSEGLVMCYEMVWDGDDWYPVTGLLIMNNDKNPLDIIQDDSLEGSVSVDVDTEHALCTLVDFTKGELTGAITLVAALTDIVTGARLMVRWINGATKYDVTLKSDADTTCATLTGVANTTVCYELVCDGSTWQLIQ
jgi:hypothetical protein